MPMDSPPIMQRAFSFFNLCKQVFPNSAGCFLYFVTLGNVARVYPGSFRVLRSSEVISLILCKMIQTGFACVAMSPFIAVHVLCYNNSHRFNKAVSNINFSSSFCSSIQLVVSVEIVDL